MLALYPTPLVVVGAMVEGKPNWVLVGHVGIIGHDRIMVSLAQPHYTNKGIKETKALSVNIIDEDLCRKPIMLAVSAVILRISQACLNMKSWNRERRS